MAQASDFRSAVGLDPASAKEEEQPEVVGALPVGTRVASYSIERVIGAGGMGAVYQAREGENLVALKVLPAEPGRDAAERVRDVRRFHNEATARESADQAVAAREIMRRGRRAECKLAEDQPLLSNVFGKSGVAGRIEDIDAGAEHRNRRSCAREPAAMRCGVDAQREAGDDREPGVAQCFGKRFGVRFALLRRVATTHDSERRPCDQFQAAARE